MSNQLIVQDDFTNLIKRWVLLDSQLKLINEKTKKIRDERNELNEKIVNTLEHSKSLHKKIIIHDGHLKVHEKRDYTPLTFSFLEQHLGKIMNDPNQVEYVIEYLKQQREIKTSNDLKRIYKNN